MMWSLNSQQVCALLYGPISRWKKSAVYGRISGWKEKVQLGPPWSYTHNKGANNISRGGILRITIWLMFFEIMEKHLVKFTSVLLKLLLVSVSNKDPRNHFYSGNLNVVSVLSYSVCQ